MPALEVGQTFPEGVSFTYVAPTGDLNLTACGLPIKYDASAGTYPSPCSPCPHGWVPTLPRLGKRTGVGRGRRKKFGRAGADYSYLAEFQNKKVVLVAVPGAFTPTCQEQHVPSYLANLEKFKAKGVDQIIVIASNDAWVMSAWGKANGVKDDSIVSTRP